MFTLLREKLDLVEVAEYVLEVPFVEIGDSTFAPEDKECPLCGHKDCFRIKRDGNQSFFKCFSCDASGDVTDFVALAKEISNVEAAKLLAKHYKIDLPTDYSPVQEAFNLAAGYYHQVLLDAGPYAELNGLTPLEYQEQIRKHKKESLNDFCIGWSDGGLIAFLESYGIAEEIIKESGLANKKGNDFLPNRCFIYPHYVRGRVSHFTFKDPLKKLAYQLPNKHKLNGHSYYGSDSIRKDGPVIIVEGENDLISIAEDGWTSGAICCNGSISSAQIEWIGTNLEKRDVITIFDTDPAGDGYREKVAKIRKRFSSLVQIKLSDGVKDIDDYLKKGGSLAAAIESNKVEDGEGDGGEDGIEIDDGSASDIIEKNGAYFRVRYKDGEAFHIKLTNFTVKLRNIYIRENEREREVVITREDGRKSEPLMITSDAKVSLKPFKALVANAIDASFYGKEEDMAAMWEYVYKTCDERVVYLPETVGRVEEFHGWLFRDCYITDTGAIYRPDDDGVIWITNHTIGLKPISIISSGKGKVGRGEEFGIPSINPGNRTEDELEELLGEFISNLGTNLGNLGDAITAVAWVWASVYSEMISRHVKQFPFLFFWGNASKGKSVIIKWLMSLLDMEEVGYTTIGQLNSGVSFGRKMSYYAALPMCIDEIRSNRDTSEWYGVFRSWFDRTGKTIGTKEGFGVKEQPIRGTLIFGGQDQFEDPATRTRCIPIRVQKSGREMVETYQWFKNRQGEFKAIGYYWVSNYSKISKEALFKDWEDIDAVLRKAGIQGRTGKIWSLIAVFALRLANRYAPDFNYMQYLFESVKSDLTRQTEDDTLTSFWETIEGMQSAERPLITFEHLKRDGDKLYVWFSEIFRQFEKEQGYGKERFSKRAVLELLREEAYFIHEGRHTFGTSVGVQRRDIVIDLTKAPDVVKNIANALG